MNNSTIEAQLNHRSIRKFKDQPLTTGQLNGLYEVARHTSSGQFLQQFSIIHVTDPTKKQQIAAIAHQPYIAGNGDLFIFIADLNRNAKIREKAHQPRGRLDTTDILMEAFFDATLAVQNMLVAAESAGLGGVVLGSIHNDNQAISDLLHLPKLTAPVLGLKIGVPDDEPEEKPRLPLDALVFENEYPAGGVAESVLADYDQTLHAYYAGRTTNARDTSFTDLIAGSGSALNDRPASPRDAFVQYAQRQGLLKR